MSQFEDLLKEVRNCNLCSDFLPHGTRPVVQLHPKATILIAGQAPGRKVHESGIPFDDASGDRLRDWMDIDRGTFYDPQQVAILPMGFCFPGTGKSGDLPPRPECAESWRRRLLDQLPALKLTLIIGQYALAYHLPERKSTLTETVRAWKEYDEDRMPLPHPSPRNNIWLRRNPWFEAELLPVLKRKIKAALLSGS